MEQNTPRPEGSEAQTPRTSVSAVQWAAIAVVIIAGILAVWFPGKSSAPASEGNAGGTTSTNTPQNAAPAAKSFSPAAGARIVENGKYVTYVYFTGHVFVPDTVTVNSGERVHFVNTSTLTMRVGSRPENLSTVAYSAITQPYAQGKGSTFDIVLSQSGVWSFENLSSTNPRVLGTVYVR